MRKEVIETLEVSCLNLLRLALEHNDLEAWASFRQGLEETVLSWFHKHPGREAVCRVQSDTHIVAQAFERLWQAVVQGQVDYATLSRVLVYLRACLNGVILETLRVLECPSVILEPDEIWTWLQVRLTNERERRLAYLLYHCGMEPAEIVQCCPQEWSDVHEVTRLRCVIVKRLMNESHH